MASGSLVQRIRSSRFFRDFSDADAEKLSAICEEVELPARQTIFEEYDRAQFVYVILGGQISLVICEPKDCCRQIAIVGEGDLIGWSPLVGRSRLSDTAITLTPVKALKFDAQQLLDFCQANPHAGYEFMRQAAAALALRLSGTRLQLLEMCGTHLPAFDINLESD